MFPIIILSNFITNIKSYSYAVPQTACFNLLPAHNSSNQLSSSPYKITLSTQYYQLNDKVKVTLSSDNLSKFRGFILQARMVKTNNVVGTWNFNATEYPFIGVIKCLDKNVISLLIFFYFTIYFWLILLIIHFKRTR